MNKVQFAVNDKVKWASQAGSYEKTKKGVIVQIVPAGIHPQVLVDHACLPRGIMGNNPRKHESYLVRVDQQPRCYWPRTCYLKRDGMLKKNSGLKKKDQTVQEAVKNAAMDCVDLATNGVREPAKFMKVIFTNLKAAGVK